MIRRRFSGIGAAIALGLAGVIFGGVGAAQAQTAGERCEKGTGEARIAACTEIINRDKKAAWAYNNRGHGWLDKGEHDKAIADYNEAIRLDPKNASTYRTRGWIWSAKGDQDKAIADYNEAIRLDPKNASAYRTRGWSWSAKGDHDKAIVDYDEAIRLDPKLAVAYINRGWSWRAKGDQAKAIEDFNEAIHLDPRDASAYSNRGYSWRAKGDHDKAIADYNEAIRLNPKDASAYSNRGLSWRAKGDHDKAIADYNEAIRLDPRDAITLNNRGFVWETKGENKQALADYEQALSIDPTNRIARTNLDRLRASIAAAAQPSSSLQSPLSQPITAPAGKRVALVIGNGGYRHAPVLENPMRDAALLATSLRSTGFQSVTVKTDLTREQTLQALKDFANEADEAEWAVVYYAGHGIEFGGANYVIPIDAHLRADRDIDLEAINIGQVLNAIEGAKRLRLVILDACRDNPFANRMRRTMASRSLGRGLGRVEPDVGTLVVYAAKHGEVALDGQGQNSPFATALARRMAERPARDVRRLFDLVRDDVMAATNRRQQPFQYGSLSGAEDFFFAR